jgi:hypothetical protein
MVTAGVYLLIRLSPIFSITPTTLTLISIIGALTAFFAASSGLVQNDVKRVIAYSTSSQLGFIPTNILFSNSFNSNNKLNNPNNDILPIHFVKKYTNITESEFYNIKTEYKNIPLIYAWYNTINGKLYVGKTLNITNRFKKYFSNHYLENHKNKMAICAALLFYGHSKFNIYILELCDLNISKQDLSLKENYWYEQIKPSYNIQKILQPFAKENHYRFGKSLSQEIKDKISNTLKNKIVSESARINHSLGARKRKVYCYNVKNNEFVISFIGIRVMVRELNLSNNSIIYTRLDKKKELNCTYKNIERSWYIYSKPLNPKDE